MALILSDRVRETTTTTGTGAFSLGGAATGYRTFSSVMVNTDTTYYACAGQGTSEWEVGIGTWNTGNTLSRTTILASSNGGSAVVFSAGTKDIFITYAAGKTVIQDASGNVGIGTSSPSVKLTVAGSTKIGLGVASNSATLMVNNLSGSATGIQLFQDGVESWIMGMPASSAALTWANSGVEQMRLTSTGLGIGTSSPGVKLDVTTATAGFYAARIFNTSITGYGLKIKNGIDSNDALRISNAADSADNILMYGSGNAYFAGSVSAGAGIGARGASISVSGSTNSSPIAAKSGSYATVFGVLPHSNSWTYLSTGVYYQNGVWTHASADTNSALLGLSGSNGGAWYASSNSSASWNVASGVGLWNASGRWVSDVTAPVDVRAPIFYDSNDTNFYGDFASNSKLYTLEVNGANANASSDSTLFVSATSSNDWGIYLSKPSWEYGIRYNLAATHTYGIYGQKNGTEYFRVGTDQGYHSASFRAPIFYDSDNTAYYGDFASTTSLRTVGDWRSDSSAWSGEFAGKIQYHADYWYLQATSGWFFRDSAANNVFQVNSSGYVGVGGVSPTAYMSGTFGIQIYHANYPGVGFASSVRNWLIYGTTNETLRVWNNSTNDRVYFYPSYTEFEGSARAPVFYDNNNTAYYGDFASTSVLSGLDVYGGGLYDDQTGFRLPLPGQAAYTTSASSVTGAIKIRIPTAALGSNTMMAFTVSVYTYDALSFDIRCGGYNYSDASKTWYNVFAYMTSASRGALNVRFGWDGTSQCIWIGELGTSWSYPQVTVRDFMGGYSGFTGPNWRSGWSVSFEASSFYSVSQTQIVYPLPYTSNNTGDIYTPRVYDSNNTAYYGDFASNSVFNNLGLGGVTPDLRLSVNGDSHMSGILYMGGTAGTFNSWGSRTYTTSGVWYNNASSVEFNNYGYGSTWTFTLGGGNAISSGSMRAPIFYDSNNTAYYGDFASTSAVNQINMAGYLRRTTSAAGYLEGGYGTATDSNSSMPIYTIGGSYQPGTTSLGNMYGIGYTYGTGTTNPGLGISEWGLYVASSGTSRIFLGSDNGTGVAASSWRAPIFYDRDNTAYYGDFASTSIVNSVNYYGIQTWSSDSAYARGTPSYGFRFNNSADTINALIVDNSGNSIAYASHRAPIFYDSNDTTFYLDPNGGSVLTNVYTYNSSYGFYARYTAGSNSYTGYYNWYGLQLGNNGANYIVAGRTAGGGNLRIYVNNTGDFPGTLGGTHSSTFDSDGVFYNYFSVRTPIFYDSNNTSYYVNPNGTSQLSYVLADDWFRPQGSTGIFWQSYSYYLYKNPDTYGNLRLGENPQNGYVGIQYFYSSSRSTTMFDSSGNGGLYNYAYWIYYWNVSNACLGVKTSATSSSYALYVDGGIYATGNITAYSDARKKTNIVTVDNALGLVNKMRGVFYNRIDSYDQKIDTNKRQIGVIAQEVNEVLPEVVTYAKDVDEYGVQYGNLAGVFIEAIKELTAKVTALEAKLAEVK